MENNKYTDKMRCQREAVVTGHAIQYEPDISELYVGFECEVLGMLDNVLVWKPTTLTLENLREGFPYTIRVKYLDRQDIESLGWKFIKEDKMDEPIYHVMTFEKTVFDFKGKFELSIPLSDSIYFVIKEHKKMSYPMDRFVGIIKNKSELVKIMSFLRINCG